MDRWRRAALGASRYCNARRVRLYSTRPRGIADPDDPVPPPAPASRSANRAGASANPPRKFPVTIDTIRSLYAKETPITVLTAHDYPTARTVAKQGGIDICLCGDSLAMVALGYESTAELPLDEYMCHLRAVRRGLDGVQGGRPLLVADLPFGSFEASVERGIDTAVSFIKARADAVKIEGGKELAPLVRALTAHGIAVMSHVGLTPQRQASLGGFRVQGKTAVSALKVLDDAQALQEAGAFAIVLEAVPSRVATYITQTLSIPTIGIGAGPGCSGQVLVLADMLGMLDGRIPRFAQTWDTAQEHALRAIDAYADEVRTGRFPVEGRHTYPMDESVWRELVEKAGWR